MSEILKLEPYEDTQNTLTIEKIHNELSIVVDDMNRKICKVIRKADAIEIAKHLIKQFELKAGDLV